LRLGIPFLTLQVTFLIVLQSVAIVVLWLLNPLTQSATDTFALYLSLDLVAFAMLSYVYRSTKCGRAPSQIWMAAGYLALVALLVANLSLA
jgi:hypothetical protein